VCRIGSRPVRKTVYEKISFLSRPGSDRRDAPMQPANREWMDPELIWTREIDLDRVLIWT
jgi:hypothetical protein